MRGGGRTRGYRETYLTMAESLAAILPRVPSVRQVIYTSSHGHLGDRQGAWTDETVPPTPLTANGEILAETERILLATSTPERCICILRLAGIYGPGRELQKSSVPGPGTTRPGTGRQYINWVHLDDIVGSIALARARQLDGIYHVVMTRPCPSGSFTIA